MASSDPTRDKLIDAAGRVFAERGYYSATVREICMRAGANVAAVNYHFRDKMGLYTEVLRQSLLAAQLDSLYNALDQDGPPEEILRTVIRVRLQGACRGKLPDWHFRIMAHEMARPTPALSRIVDQVGKPVYERMRRLIGGILGLPPDHEKTRLCAHSIMGQILFYIHESPWLARLWPELNLGSEQLDRIADHIADFSLAYLRAAGTRNGQATPASRVRRKK